MTRRRASFLSLSLVLVSVTASAAEKLDFNRDIRPILSNNCFLCHGPDPTDRKGGPEGLRLDTREGAMIDLGGYSALVPGKPEASGLIARIESHDPAEIMPPPKSGKKLTPAEIEKLKTWIRQDAPYAKHWSFEKPVRPAVPVVKKKDWVRNEIDAFILARLEHEGLTPSAEADRATLLRRVAFDLTGLPPTADELAQFLADRADGAYERAVDRLLEKTSYGEHWARGWLDLARYADSAGYADDPPRQIWGYRDWVIRAFNSNMPFDRFTIEQLAGDMLPNPTNDQLIATAFHRNTLTNNEGGTNDEEYRNVAIVDRVNTTMAVWMGLSYSCSQCHNHKYDPIMQEEYFRTFAIFNNTEDADRRDESPLISFMSPEQEAKKASLETELAAAEKELQATSPDFLASLAKWETTVPRDLTWRTAKPSDFRSRRETKAAIRDDGSILTAAATDDDTYTVTLPIDLARLGAIRLEALADDSLPGKGPGWGGGNFVITNVSAVTGKAGSQLAAARFVRVEIPGPGKMVSLAEVQVLRGTENFALTGEAKQSSTDYDGPAKLAIDGNTNGEYAGKSVTHTAISDNPWWELDLKQTREFERIVLWNRTDSDTAERIAGAKVSLLNEKRETVWQQTIEKPFPKEQAFSPGGGRTVTFVAALADHEQSGFPADDTIDRPAAKKMKQDRTGWAIAPHLGENSTLVLATEAFAVEPGSNLTLTIEQRSQQKTHTLGAFRVSLSDDPRAAEFAKHPAEVLAALRTAGEKRSEAEKSLLVKYYAENLAPEKKAVRENLAKLKKQIADFKPNTVPIFRELQGKARRVSKIQHRGNFLDLGAEVTPGVPKVFPPLPEGSEPNRLTFANWLLAPENPLTARVTANRYWEQIFGIGLVRTSEEFGSQGELPSHGELLDWLAVELRESKWDLKRFLKMIVTSSAYRQSSKAMPADLQRDPENRLLARGPTVRLTAEMIRDQALAVSGLLSPKMFGPSVRPARPNLGLNAAFGGGLDWQTSEGEDRYRRAVYTEWRRTSPYPSMTTFDAPSRETCTLRRNRTNTPLQALVTLNDPVYLEAAQAFSRRIAAHGITPSEKIAFAVKFTLSREPREAETKSLLRLYEESKADFAANQSQAVKLSVEPLGPLPTGLDPVEAAAWTVVANVLLNLDETFTKR